MKRMSTTLVTAAILFIVVPSRAEAGAPNYECEAGGYRFGIDQHRRGGIGRINTREVVPVSYASLDQNGPSLDATTTFNGKPAAIQVRGTGSSMTVTTGGRTLSGACAFVPGNFALGQVMAPHIVVRTAPSDSAAVAVMLHRGSLVWSPGRFNDATGKLEGTEDWTQLRVVLRIEGGAKNGEEQMGMGTEVGLDGRSSIVNGWVRVTDVKLIGPPGP